MTVVCQPIRWVVPCRNMGIVAVKRLSNPILACKDVVRFRVGEQGDRGKIQALVWSERMNPLALDPQRFVVATINGDDMVAAGQLAPLEEGVVELRSMVVVPEYRYALK